MKKNNQAVQMSIQIDRPVDEVFARLGNFENNPRWQSTSLESEKISDGPVGNEIRPQVHPLW